MENKSHVPNHHTERADDAKVPPPLNVATQKKPAFLWEFHGDLRWICLRGPKKKRLPDIASGLWFPILQWTQENIGKHCQWIILKWWNTEIKK